MIEVRHLTRRFSAGRGLFDFSCVVGDGERVALVGPTGSGKTTLLRIVAGLETPDEGEVLVDREVVSGPGVMVAPHVRQLGFMFQAPTLWPHMTVAEQVLFGLHALTARDARRRLEEVLDDTGLRGLAQAHPIELSGGQARLAALARTIAPRPKHLLLDEPLANLDGASRDRVLTLIDRTARECGCALCVVTHDLTEAGRLGTRFVRLEEGRLEDRADYEEVRS